MNAVSAQHGVRVPLTCTVCWWSAADSIVFCLQTYIDFEISEGNRDRARKLYERLLARTKHVKVRTNEPAISKQQQLLVTITLVPDGVACSPKRMPSACSSGWQVPPLELAGAVDLVV